MLNTRTRGRRAVPIGALVALLAGVAPSQQPTEVTIHEPGRAFTGWTTEITELRFHASAEEPRFRVFDLDGNVVHTWFSPYPGWGFGELVKPLSSGRILAILRKVQGSGKILAELDWNSNVLWSFNPEHLGIGLHHDFERLPNGNTLLLASKSRVAPWIRQQPIDDDIILEIDRNGAIVWAWSTVDNAHRLPLPPAAWAYLSESTLAVLFHTNSVHSLPPNRWEQNDARFRRGNLLVSQRDTNLVFLIDKATGRVVWRYRGAIGQHHARMIPMDLPGAGNILLYDNGGRAGAPPIGRQYSRVIEIDPLTKQEVWVYDCTAKSERACSAGLTSKFFSAFMGCAQRLPNGNTLITESANGRLFEVTVDRKIVWEYIIAGGEQIYRGYRWPNSWPYPEGYRFPW